MKKLYLKALLFLCLVGGIIAVVDFSGMFKPDQVSSHERRQWNSFYNFTKKNEIDVLMVGNSHLYTGINPNHLSCVLGANCFILASPGTSIIDTYFALNEGLTRCSPKLVVVETYGIMDTEVRKMAGGPLSCELRSFTSRKNIFLKLLSTPKLFSSDNYLIAWSPSIQGHDMIFRNQTLLKANLTGKNVDIPRKGLELGRFTRFNSGITDEADKEYDEKGAVVDGAKFKVNKENYVYTKKIQSLCDKKGIKLVFLTLPMYYKHVKNYPSWHTIISRVIGTGYFHLDLQDPYDYELFTKDCFENTRDVNQHMTHVGAFIADYKLANFLIEDVGVELPDRHLEKGWRLMFSKEAGYYEHYTVDPDDTKNFLLCERVEFGDFLIKDCAFIPNDTGAQVFMRVDKRTDAELVSRGMELLLDIAMEDGSGSHIWVPLYTQPGIEPLDHYILWGSIKGPSGIKAVRIESAAVL